jgi:hypothetical protein
MACLSLFNELYAILVSINELCELLFISRALLVQVSLFNELYAILFSINELCDCVIYFQGSDSARVPVRTRPGLGRRSGSRLSLA